MKVLSVLLKYSRGSFLLAVVSGVLAGLASAGLLALINTIIARGAESVGSVLVWVFAALCLLVPMMRFASAYVLMRMSQKAVFDLRLEMSRNILRTPLRQLEKVGPPKLLAALTQDIGSMAMALSDLPVLCMSSAVIVGSLTYLGWLSWQALLVVLGFMAVGVVSYRLPMRWGTARQRLAREEGDALYQHFKAVTEGAKELKLHDDRRLAFLEQLEGSAGRFQKLNIAARSIFVAAASWGQTLFFIAVGLVILAGPRILEVDREVLTGFALVLLYIMNPLQGVLDFLPQFSQAGVALAKVERLGLSLTEDASPESLRPASETNDWHSITMEGVVHSYYEDDDDRHFTLGPLDFTLKRGEVVFVVGGNGSGKTTLIKVLAGLYEPAVGRVLVDGEEVSENDWGAYRQRFSAIFADFFLFDTLLGLDHSGLDERAKEYLRELRIDHKVKVEDGKLSTMDLSQGQRKRLALLTAYLEDRSVYVFDEWAADQDPIYKEVFYHEILPGLKERGKAVVVVCHDDRYFTVADRILKLEEGRVSVDQAVHGKDSERLPETFEMPPDALRVEGT